MLSLIALRRGSWGRGRLRRGSQLHGQASRRNSGGGGRLPKLQRYRLARRACGRVHRLLCCGRCCCCYRRSARARDGCRGRVDGCGSCQRLLRRCRVRFLLFQLCKLQI